MAEKRIFNSTFSPPNTPRDNLSPMKSEDDSKVVTPDMQKYGTGKPKRKTIRGKISHDNN